MIRRPTLKIRRIPFSAPTARASPSRGIRSRRTCTFESVLRPKPAAAPLAAAPRVRTQNLDLDERELQRIIEREFGPQKTPLYRPPAAKAEAAVTLPPRRKEYLIVDGYNMIFAWDGLREQAGYDLSGARERLLDLLSNYCGFHPCELIVVFDSYRVRGGTGPAAATIIWRRLHAGG